MRIPQADPGAFVLRHRAEIDEAIGRVLDSGLYVLGPEVAGFESEFAGFVGVPHAVGVSCGTEALWLALKAQGIGSGDEVITVSLTATATAAAIVEAEARPVFVDICADDLTIDPAAVASALTARTRAIVPVHLYGQAARLNELLEFGVPVIEDCAQAHGARCGGRPVGSLGCAGAFSFYPTKNMGAMGDAGAITVSDPALAARLREMRQHGWRKRYVSATHGWNSRLDELQAAILRIRLRHLAADNARRAEIAAAYTRTLTGTGIAPAFAPADRSCVWHQYVLRHPRRDAICARLAAAGIGSAIHYPTPIHLQPAYRSPRHLPVTERAAGEVLSLPIYPELSDEDISSICICLTGAARDLA